MLCRQNIGAVKENWKLHLAMMLVSQESSPESVRRAMEQLAASLADAGHLYSAQLVLCLLALLVLQQQQSPDQLNAAFRIVLLDSRFLQHRV